MTGRPAHRLLRVVFLATLASTCGGGPSAPAPPPGPAPIQIGCPAPFIVEDAMGASQPVTFAAPSVSGGSQPVTVSCTPASGSHFPLGDTTVRCTASDSQGRQASCSFSVGLRRRPLSVTRILAFGDSMTEGENGRPGFIDIPNAYPTILQRLFDAAIPGQSITVINEGVGGERVTESDERLKHEIGKYQPQVLLLLEGINDLGGGVTPSRVADAIRDSIDTALERGVAYVFVSTLLPTATGNCLDQPGAPRCRGNDIAEADIVEANSLIRAVVPAAGGHLVDPYAEFVANRATYVDNDGLHLAPEGNRALASAFWSRIVEVVPAQALAGTPLSSPR